MQLIKVSPVLFCIKTAYHWCFLYQICSILNFYVFYTRAYCKCGLCWPTSWKSSSNVPINFWIFPFPKSGNFFTQLDYPQWNIWNAFVFFETIHLIFWFLIWTNVTLELLWPTVVSSSVKFVIKSYGQRMTTRFIWNSKTNIVSIHNC